MTAESLSPQGIVVAPTALTLPRARALAEAIGSGRLPYIEPVDCLQHCVAPDLIEETVVFEVEVERPQKLAHDIRRKERIAVIFKPATYRRMRSTRRRSPLNFTPRKRLIRTS